MSRARWRLALSSGSIMSRTSPHGPPVAGRARPLVLVADDDADLRGYVAASLAKDGRADVVEAASGAVALTIARALRPDLVVSDLAMPGLDGAALCHALHLDPVTRGVPVLIVSGATRSPPWADGFLAKPFNAAALRTEADRLLARPPAAPAL